MIKLPTLSEVNASVRPLSRLPQLPRVPGSSALEAAAEAAREALSAAIDLANQTQSAEDRANEALNVAQRSLAAAEATAAPLNEAARLANEAVTVTAPLGGAAAYEARQAANSANIAANSANALVEEARAAVQPLASAAQVASATNSEAQDRVRQLTEAVSSAEQAASAASGLATTELPQQNIPAARPAIRTPKAPGLPNLSFNNVTDAAQMEFISRVTGFVNSSIDAKLAPVQTEINQLATTTITPSATAVPNPGIGIAATAAGKAKAAILAVAGKTLMTLLTQLVSKIASGTVDASELGNNSPDENSDVVTTPTEATIPEVLKYLPQDQFDAVVAAYNSGGIGKAIAELTIRGYISQGYSPPYGQSWPDGSVTPSATKTTTPTDTIQRIPLEQWQLWMNAYNMGGINAEVVVILMKQKKDDGYEPPVGENWPAELTS